MTGRRAVMIVSSTSPYPYLRRWPELLQRTSENVENARLSRAAREFYLRTYDREVIAQQYDRLFDLSYAPLKVADNGVVGWGNPA